jgi:hypothetical protein
MNLPNYQMIPIKNPDVIQVSNLLFEDINLRRPIVFVLSTLKLDEQRDVIGVIENWFETHQASWRYPYPVYIVSDFGEAISRIPIVKDVSGLPKFYQVKETKTTVKESQVLDRNKLLQQEIKNSDPTQMTKVLQNYGIGHKKIWHLTREAEFYEHLWNKLNTKKKNKGSQNG